MTPMLAWGHVGGAGGRERGGQGGGGGEREVGYFDVPIEAGSGQGGQQQQGVGAPAEISPPSPRSSYTSSKTESLSGSASGFGFEDTEGRSSSLGTSVDGGDDMDEFDSSLEAKNATAMRMHSDPLIIPVGSGMHKRSKSTSASGSSSGDTDRPGPLPSSSSPSSNDNHNNDNNNMSAIADFDSPPLPLHAPQMTTEKKRSHPKFDTSEFADIVSGSGSGHNHLLGAVGLGGGTPGGRRASWTPSTERPNFL